jgi:hypothetical protein
MGGARLALADMSGAMVWRTVPPASKATTLADLANFAMNAPSAEDIGQTKLAVAALETGPLKVRLTSLMIPLHDAGPNGVWAASADGQAWTSLAKGSEAAMADGYRVRLTEELARLACRAPFAGGAVATGIARRAVAAGFKGDSGMLYDRLKAPDCVAAQAVSAAVLRELAAAAEAARQ